MEARNTLPTCEVTSDQVNENTCLLNKDAAVMGAHATQPQQGLEYHDSCIHDQHQAEMLRRRNCKQTFAVFCILSTALFSQMFFETGFLRNWSLESDSLPSKPYIGFIVTGVYTGCILIGGLIADGKLGRFKTIIGAALLSIFACTLWGIYHFEERISEDSDAKAALYYVALVLYLIGISGMVVNIIPFGADQVSNVDRQRVEKFFLWLYGAFVFGGLLTRIGKYVLIGQGYSFNCYIISACSSIVALAVFALGHNSYVTVPLLDSFVLDACKILWSAMITRIRRQGAGAVQVESWLDSAKRSFGGMFTDTKVEDVKLLLKLLPIFLATMVYWSIFFQMLKIFGHQGVHMNLTPLNSKHISVDSLVAFEYLAAIILIPVINKLVFPILAHCGVRLTPLKKMGAGMLFAAASFLVAVVIEMERKKPKYGIFQQELYNYTVNATDLSIFYQSPQYLLLGTADVLVWATGCEFAYTESPRYIHSVIIAMAVAPVAAGSCLGSAILRALKLFQGDQVDIFHDSQEYFIFIMVGLTVVNFLVFAAVSSKYRYQSIPTPIVRIGNFNFMDQRNI